MRYLLFVVFSFIVFSLQAQYVIDFPEGIILRVDVYGASGTDYNEATRTITYSKKHKWSSISVSAFYDFSNYEQNSTCGSNSYHVVTNKQAYLNSSAIVSYTPEGEVDSSASINKMSKNLHDSKTASLSMGSGGAVNTSFQVGLFAHGFCADLVDSILTTTTGGAYNISVKPTLNIGTIANGYDDGIDYEGRQLKSGFNPPIDIKLKNKPTPWPVDDDFINEDEEISSCDLYGRPKFSVNMHTLDLLVKDVEFLHGGRGIETRLSRYYRSGIIPGMFGKGWLSNLESYIFAPAIFDSSATLIKVNLSNERERQFIYDTANQLFISSSPIDSLYFNDSMLVYRDTEKMYNYIFDTLSELSTQSKKYYLKYIKDAFNNEHKFEYDNQNRLSSVTDAVGRKTVLVYNDSNWVSSIVLSDGRNLSYTYNDEGFLTNSIDLNGNETDFFYDTLLNISSYSFNGKITSFQYQLVGGRSFIEKITDPSGAEYLYELTMWTNFSSNSVTDPLGNITRYNHDSYGRLTSLTDHNWNSYNYSYDEYGQMIQKETPYGNTADYSYDDNGLLNKIIYNSYSEYTLKYDSLNNLIEHTDPYSNAHGYVYDNKRRVIAYINPNNDSTVYLYNSFGDITQVIMPNGRIFTYDYDNFGNISTMEDNLGEIVEIIYDPWGYLPLTVTDALGNSTQYLYDNNGRIISVITPGANEYKYEYNCCGLASITYPDGRQTEFERDLLNSLTEINFPGNKTFSLSYDAAHNVNSITDNEGNAHTLTYNNNNLPVAIENPEGDIVEYAWNEDAMLTSVIDERDNTILYNYSQGKLYSTIYPDNNEVLFIRDKMGRILRQENARDGQQIEYTYNFAGKVLSKTLGATTYNYTYNKQNRLYVLEENEFSMQYNRDIRERISSINYNNAYEIGFEYNNADLLTNVIYPDAFRVRYEYNNQNQVSALFMGNDSVKFDYDGNGNVISEQRSNTTNSIYSFSEDGKIVDIDHRFMGMTKIKLGYSYNENGNINKLELLFPDSISPSYTSGTANYSFNNLNQLVSDGTNTYTYDKDGNLIEISGDKNTQFTYTFENLPQTVSNDSNFTEYKYNGIKQLISKSKNEVNSILLYDANNKLLAELDTLGNTINKYIYAGNRLTAKVNSDGSVFFYHFDKNGSTLALSNSNSQMVNTYLYTPFGEKVSKKELEPNVFTFIGAFNVIDDNNGYYLMGMRIYDPANGRFIQRDPLGMIDGTNLYTYALNNPLIHIDPEGTDVANGTTNLYTCQGPVYGDDFFSEETAGVLRNMADIGTDLIPVVNDVKSVAKAGYYAHKGDYLKAGSELTTLGVGKYLGGKLSPKISNMLGTDVAENTTNYIIGKITGVVVNEGAEGVSNFNSNNASDNKVELNTNSGAGWGPPAGIAR